MRKSLVCLLLILFCCRLFAADQDILNHARIPRGVACIPGCTDGEPALALAEKGWLVLALNPDGDVVDSLRKEALATGHLGRHLYVQQGVPDKIPFADNYVDLLLLTHSKEEELKAALRVEIMRVLTPVLGRAVLADSVIEKPELPGSDWWTHKRHGPDNNPVSKDTAFQVPAIQQYRALPMFNPAHGATVTSDGINLEIMDWEHQPFEVRDLCGRMFARNIYNGRIIWQAETPYGLTTSLPTLAAIDGVVYLPTVGRAAILRRELTTGKELAPIELGGKDLRVKWLAVEGGRLYALLGGPHLDDRPFTWWVPGPMENVEKHSFFGPELVAWDLGSGKELWRHREKAAIDYRHVAIEGGRLYYYGENTALACLSLSDGRPVWRNEDPDLFGKYEYRIRKYHKIDGLNQSKMLVADGLLMMGTNVPDQPTYFFDSSNGKLLGKYDARLVPHKNAIIAGIPYCGPTRIDPASGKALSHRENLPCPLGIGGCGISTYAPGTGMMGHVNNLGYKSPCFVGAWVAGGILLNQPTICQCMSIRGSGGFASGKALLERIEKHAEHPLVRGPSYRTRATAADPSSPGKPGYDAASWPSHRGGVTRTGASRAATPTRAQISWTAQPEHPFKFTTAVNRHGLSFDERPVPPIIAAGTCFSAGSDGVISARSMADGRLRWRCAIDGPVLTPPAYAAGRLFVPGGDGWVYALDASNGSLAWKRRLAPMERRILLFEQLMSTWPVLSLAVADGVVYATAGMMPHDGGRSFALDAQGGDILWERFHRPTLGRWPTERQGFAGHTAVIGQRVWVPGYRSLQLCLDRSDGADPLVGLKKKLRRVHFVTTDTLYTNNGGQDVIQLGPEHVLVGGTHLLEEQNIRFSKHRGYRLFRVDAKGDWGVEADGPANVIHPSRVAPACDGKLIAFASPPMTMKRGQRSQRSNLCLNAWSLDRFLKEAHATAKLVVAKELEDKIEVKAEFGRGAFNDMPYDKANWQLPELEINVLALADNAVIAAYAAKVEKVSGKRPTTLRERIDNNRRPFVRFSDWKIGAFARKDGKEIWSLNLPCEPLYNGLAIAGDGSVVVTLRDGTMVGISKEEVSK